MKRHACGNDVWAVMPVKRFAHAKMRLDGMLRPLERAALAKAMMADVLEKLLPSAGIAGVLVITNDPEASEIAANFGAEIVADDCESGTNGAVRCGMRHIVSVPGRSALVVSADLPFLTEVELKKVVSALDRSPVAIVPAQRDGGTNILAFSPPCIIEPAFGPGSFANHFKAAETFCTPVVLRLEGAGHDIDIPADLSRCRNDQAGPRTQECFRRFGFVTPASSSRYLEEALR